MPISSKTAPEGIRTVLRIVDVQNGVVEHACDRDVVAAADLLFAAT